MKYLDHVIDRGVVLAPDAPDQPLHCWDGGGAREAILNREGGFYYLNYDGAMPGAAPDSYWNACLARSTDLLHWEKLGPCLYASILAHPQATPQMYKDLRSASSPWSFYADGRWYHYYVGADHCSPEGVPAFLYSTMLATSDSMAGPWDKRCDAPGCAKHVCFPAGAPGGWNDVTASPGQVLENPRWAADPAHQKRYLMLYSGACSGTTKRSLGIARTDDLGTSDAYDAENGHFWQLDPGPILPPEEDIENTSLFFEESSGLYWLFTNHIRDNSYTDAVWVYWSPDIERWDPAHKAVVLDASVSSWAKGAIGMPTVLQKDAATLAMVYDAVPGDGIGHLGRQIGLAEISLPLTVR